MEPVERLIEYYRTIDLRVPFGEWHDSLKDVRTQAIADVRIARLRAGNFGYCRSVGAGVLELKIDYGPGYRIYLRPIGPRVVLLLTGGDKSSQSADIREAKKFWQDYQARFL